MSVESHRMLVVYRGIDGSYSKSIRQLEMAVISSTRTKFRLSKAFWKNLKFTLWGSYYERISNGRFGNFLCKWLFWSTFEAHPKLF